MAWIKNIDRTKFPKKGMLMGSRFGSDWIIGMYPDQHLDGDPIAKGVGKDPLEAMLALCINLDAIRDTGEWDK